MRRMFLCTCLLGAFLSASHAFGALQAVPFTWQRELIGDSGRDLT